jgi:asparagine synthase (glutamine-hydrolysing)
MTVRFVAKVLKPSLQPAAQALSPPPCAMSRVHTRPGLELWANAPTYVLHPEAAPIIVIGTAINKVTGRSIGSSDRLPTGCSPREWLIKAWWGAYVAFVVGQRDEVAVIRDPSGMFPCYWTDMHDAIVFASDPTLFKPPFVSKPLVDWKMLDRHLRARDLRTSDTCLQGVHEVMPGTCVETTALTSPYTIWSPWDYVTPSATSEADMAKRLRQIVGECVNALVPGGGHVLLGVSGGLDSSIVSACLGDRATYYTMATEGGVGDERWIARLLADHQSRPLRDFVFRLSDIDIYSSASQCLARPTRLPFQQAIDRVIVEILGREQFSAVFNGNGGDNVFCFLTSASPLVDRWRTEGIGPGVIQTLLDISSRAGVSLWTVVEKAIAHNRRSATYVWKGDDRFLHDRAAIQFAHPWLDSRSSALPGKAAHIALLLRIQNHIEGSRREAMPPVISPLLAQPIIELCLSVPSWQWCRGGKNRSLARLAFADLLPREIIQRKAKGAPDSFSIEILEAHRGAVREGLADGLLASHDILDRDAVAGAMKGRTEMRPDISLRLSMLWEAELWSRAWMP